MKQKYRFFHFLLTGAIAFSLGFHWEKVEGVIQNYSLSEVEEMEENSHGGLRFDLFDSVWTILQSKYVNPEIFSENEPFEYGIIKGLILGLDDPFSAFMTPEENKEFRDELQGNFEGIGAELTMKSGAVTVVTPLKGSPAKEAGLMPEDIILKVDDEDIVGESLINVVKKIRGEKGTKVVLSVFRPSDTRSVDIEIIRETITVASVESEMKEDIAYIEINQFGDTTRYEFESQLQSILKENPKGVILDLRFNGGGYLESAVDIASAFFEETRDIVIVKTKNSSFIHKSRYKPFANKDIPLVVLVNKGSASASEILAGAIQDHKRGLVVGEVSFGKGTVQEVIPLQGGASLRVTIAQWLTPNGNMINKEGIHPDIVVEKTSQDFEEEKNPQLDKALEVLRSGEYVQLIK